MWLNKVLSLGAVGMQGVGGAAVLQVGQPHPHALRKVKPKRYAYDEKVFLRSRPLTRVSNPGGFYPDPDPTSEILGSKPCLQRRGPGIRPDFKFNINIF